MKNSNVLIACLQALTFVIWVVGLDSLQELRWFFLILKLFLLLWPHFRNHRKE